MMGSRTQLEGIEAPRPDELVEGEVSTGIAFQSETGERLGTLQLRCRESGELIFDAFFTVDVAQQILDGLLAMEPWFGVNFSASRREAGGAGS